MTCADCGKVFDRSDAALSPRLVNSPICMECDRQQQLGLIQLITRGMSMTYGELRMRHLESEPRLNQYAARDWDKVLKVHRVLISLAAEKGAGAVVTHRNRFRREAMKRLGINPFWSAIGFGGIWDTILSLIWPIILKWIQDILDSLDDLFSAGNIDRELKRLAMEAQS